MGVSAWKMSFRKNVSSSLLDDSTHDDRCLLVPVAIQTYPLNGGAERRQAKSELGPPSLLPVNSPFPTLFWLTCPDIARAVADLESRGYIQMMEKELDQDPVLSRRLVDCHQEYASLRWESLADDDRNLLLMSSSSSPHRHSLGRMRTTMECSGIAGTNFTPAVDASASPGNGNGDSAVGGVPPIKCLHAHYAHFRSTALQEMSSFTAGTINPVGEMIHAHLLREFPHLDL